MIKVVLFDIDGTLLNTTELIYQAFEHSLKTHGHKVLSREKMAITIGKSLEDCYLDFAPNGDPILLSKTHNEFQLKNTHLAITFPDTIETLGKLKDLGLKMAGITNRWKSNGILSVKHTGIDKFLEFVWFRDDVKKLKPDREPIKKALKVLGYKKANPSALFSTNVFLEKEGQSMLVAQAPRDFTPALPRRRILGTSHDSVYFRTPVTAGKVEVIGGALSHLVNGVKEKIAPQKLSPVVR